MDSTTEQIETEKSTIAIMILAAGASTRMGTPKQLLLYQKRSLVQYITEIAIASVCKPVVVVLGAYSEQIRPQINHLPVSIVENLDWACGMSTSINSAIQFLHNLSQNIEAVVIVVCDQPFLSPQIINQLVDAYYSTKKPIIACEYAGTLGVPALFSKRFFYKLAELQGTSGAKKVINNNVTLVFSLPFAQGDIDIDTPKDYEQLLSINSDYI
ncbi:nucleotidyltransferase family protein [Brasilonema octagenarum UFV-E1]|uniref:Nucleotidyltransferase family protein n=2 Tax=Brasilonema TaxID=383614 RepID=A0A856MF58_9CYAN|nr:MULTISPECIES: nucleotidyltransferase family protein [Brasilonema]NMF67310.1 nucleotidyltransferase family protein [Brasilonema octagenarum UFV-OR1]QDL09282.1 nucleotidyltransferase family protein [Brasilonema sennae CENA114]QDL15639.1 nucleotidyltransferase family protein [Brasilonema octagenarum UFV-E1]